MQEKTYENNLDALNKGIAQLREEIAALADGDERHGGWANFRGKLGEVGAKGEKVAEGIAHEIERHPLIGGMIAFGLGFFIARLLWRRSKIEGNPSSF